MFVLLGGLVFFAWGEVASLFPTTCTDYFGDQYATTNAGLLYTSKGVARCWCRSPCLLAAEPALAYRLHDRGGHERAAAVLAHRRCSTMRQRLMAHVRSASANPPASAGAA